MASTNAALLVPPATNADASLLTNDIRAIQPPVNIPSGWAWLGWLLAGAVLAALAVLLWRRWRRQQQAVAVPPVPPHIRAKQRLNEALLHIGDARLFCFLISETLRVYLEERFELRAPERTTEEFLQDLQGTSHLNGSQKQSLTDFLERCDLVKFARFEPTEVALRDLHDAALRLVDETQYEPLSVPEQPALPGAPPPAPPGAHDLSVAGPPPPVPVQREAETPNRDE